MRTFAVIGFGLFVYVAAFGQAPALQSFEVADVHPSPRATALPFRVFSYGGRYEIHNATMVDLIRTAYTVDDYKILGGPNWIEYDRFDIIAKVPPNTGREALKPMLRALLKERFNLHVHNGTEAVSVLALTLGKGKPKMKESDGSGDEGCHRQIIPSPLINLSCHNITMEEFAAGLKTIAGEYVPKLVMDSTGLKGGWDFDFKFTPYERISAPGSSGISLSEAMDKQLGLKLEQRQLPADVLIVESVNRKPSENSPDIDAKLPPSPAEFEVASVKPAPPDARHKPLLLGVMPGGGGLIQFGPNSLKELVAAAWNLNLDDEIPGAPKWLDSALFYITGRVSRSRVPENGGPSLPELAPELQALLKDRFKIEIHFEDRLVPAYTLAVTKPKLKNADPAIRTRCTNTAQGGGVVTPSGIFFPARLVTCQNMTMSQLAEQIQILAPTHVRFPVVDATGLDGGWDFSFTFDPPILRPINWRFDTSYDLERTTILQGVEKLGLKLEAQKRSYPVMVIDHIEQKPTDD